MLSCYRLILKRTTLRKRGSRRTEEVCVKLPAMQFNGYKPAGRLVTDLLILIATRDVYMP